MDGFLLRTLPRPRVLGPNHALELGACRSFRLSVILSYPVEMTKALPKKGMLFHLFVHLL
eukprot:8004661-Pyramimonas_sp.AAC.2